MNDNDVLNYLRETGYGDVLLAAVEQGHLTDDTVTGADGTEHDVDEAGAALEARGLVHLDKRLAGTIVQANGRGKQIAKRIQQSRESGEDRWDAVTRAVAAGLLSDDPDAWRVEEVDGRPVTESELTIAVDNLERWGCAKPIRAMGNVTVRLLPKDRLHQIPGIQGLLRNYFEGSTGSSVDQSTHNTTTVGGNAHAVQTGGVGNVQTVTVTTMERAEILAGIGQVRAAMGNDAAPELVQAVDAIETEARSDDATKASVGQQVQSALITAGTSAATTGVFQGLTHLLSLALG